MTNGNDESQDDEQTRESLGAKVSPDLKQRVRILAAHKGINMSEYVRQAVEKQVEEDLEEGNSTSLAPQIAD